MAARLAISGDETAAFGSLQRPPWPEELRAQFPCLPDALEAAAAMLDQLADKAIATGASSLSLWQVAYGITTPQPSTHGWIRARTHLRMVFDLADRPRLPRSPDSVVRQADKDVELPAGARVDRGDAQRSLRYHRLDFHTFHASQAARNGHDPSL